MYVAGVSSPLDFACYKEPYCSREYQAKSLSVLQFTSRKLSQLHTQTRQQTHKLNCGDDN